MRNGLALLLFGFLFFMLIAPPAIAAPRSRLSQAAAKPAVVMAIPLSNPELEVEGAEKLNFKAALQRALDKSPDYDIAVRSRSNSELRSKNAWSLLLPSLDLTANHTFGQLGVGNDNYRAFNQQPWTNQLGLRLSENLYNNGENYRLAKIADLEFKVGELSLLRSKNQILVNVAKAYYDFSEAAGNYSLTVAQLKTLKEQFKTMESRYFQGLSSNRDYLRIKADTQRSEVNALTQKYNVQEKREALKAVIGDSGNLDFEPYDPRGLKPDGLTFPTLDPEKTLDFRIASATQDVAEIRNESVRREYWPRLSLQGSYELVQPNYLGNRTDLENQSYTNLQGLIVLEYNIWDWGIRRRNVEISNNEWRIEISKQETTRIQVRQNLRNLNANKTTLLESFKISSQILSASEDVYVSLNRAYREGKVTYIDLINALGDFYGSRTQNLSLRYNLLKLRADLAFYEGNADEVLNAQ
jgi:outer membrane protein